MNIMKRNILPHPLQTAVLTMAALALCAGVTAQAQLIDDFSGGLGAYTLTRILDNGVAEANVSFSSASGSLVASYAGTVSQAEQVVFLRSDYSLSVGSMLLVNVLFPTQTSQMDFGIAVSSTATPTSVANPTPTDTRNTFNWAAVYVRPSQDTVRNTSSINGTVVTATGISNAVETTVSQLYIARTSATSFTLGFIDSSSASHDTRTITFTATDVGTAIGFYGDLRTIATTLGSLDNLTIAPIPEPATMSLCGLGGLLGLAGWLRRK
jgi:hypothetical protein